MPTLRCDRAIHNAFETLMNERCDQSKRNERHRKKRSFAENLAMGAYVRRDRKRTRAAHERVCRTFRCSPVGTIK